MRRGFAGVKTVNGESDDHPLGGFSIRLAKQRNVGKLDMLLFQFAKARKSSRLILSKEPGNVLLRVSYKWAIGYDWVSLGLSRI